MSGHRQLRLLKAQRNRIQVCYENRIGVLLNAHARHVSFHALDASPIGNGELLDDLNHVESGYAVFRLYAPYETGWTFWCYECAERGTSSAGRIATVNSDSQLSSDGNRSLFIKTQNAADCRGQFDEPADHPM